MNSRNLLKPFRTVSRLLRRAGNRPEFNNDGRYKLVVELSSFDKGGLEKVVLDTAKALPKEKYQTLIVTPGKLGHHANEAKRTGINVLQLVDPESDYKRLIRDFSPDLYVTHFSDLGYSFFHDASIPIVSFIHNVYAFLNIEARRKLIDQDKLIDRYIAVSRKAGEYAVEHFQISPSKVTTVPNGLILADYERLENTPTQLQRSALGLAENDYVFINPASYNLHKGHYLMARALKIAIRTNPNIRILCVGNEVHKPHADQLRGYVASEGLGQHFLMPGYFKNIAEPMGISDACLMPSFIEGWSIAMNEAMYFGKPLILSDTGGAGEVIEDRDIGILVPTEYPDFRTLEAPLLDKLAYAPTQYQTEDLIARAMVEFASDKKKWAKAGERAREKLVSNYDFASVVSQYDEIFSDLIRKKRSPSQTREGAK